MNPKKIKLNELPELKDHVIYQDEKSYMDFIAKLRQDTFSLKELNAKGYFPDKEIKSWLDSRKPGTMTFFAIFDEADNHAKNDSWGGHHVYRCLVVITADKQVELFKKEIRYFWH